MRFTTFLAAFIYALPVLAADTTVPAISTGSVITLTTTPAINTPIASGSKISSSVSTAAPPTPTNVWEFAQPENVTICHAVTFTWSFLSASEIPMTLVVTNEEGILPDGLEPSDYELVSRTLTNDISSNSGIFVWQSVDVPIGPYVIVAFNTEHEFNGPVIMTRSLPFYVRPGLDESCLDITDPLTPSPSSPAETSGSGDAASLATQHQTLSHGAIAGIVIGSVAGVALIVGAIFFARRRSRSLARHRESVEGAQGPYAKF